jgi:hypothetical protein
MKIRVNYVGNFYNGREGEVLRSTWVGDTEVFWVAVSTTAGGTVEFALREEHLVRLDD